MPTKSIKRQAPFNPRLLIRGNSELAEAARGCRLVASFFGDPFLLWAPDEIQRSFATVNSRRCPSQPCCDNRRVGVATFEQREELRVVLRAPWLA